MAFLLLTLINILWMLSVPFCANQVFADRDEDIPIVESSLGKITTAVEDEVLVLTRENFDLQIASKETMLVEFYAPWCGHCKSLAPEYSKAAKMLKDEDLQLFLAKVDATIETEIASRFEVTGYPTLYLFKNGRHIPYDGPRSALGIVEYMKEHADPNWKPPPEAVLTLTNENFTTTVNNADIILVEFYAPWCGHCKRLAPEYERAARVLKDLPRPIFLSKVNGIEEKDLAEKYEARGWPTLMIFRRGQKYAYEGPRDETGIISYMKEQARPPSQEVSSAKILKQSLGKIDCTVVGFFHTAGDHLYHYYLETANVLREKFTFLHTFEKDIADHFNAERPQIVLYHPEIYATEFEPSVFKISDEASSSQEITQFIRNNHLPLVGERAQNGQWKYQDKYPLVVVYYDVDFSFEHRKQTQLIRKEVAKVAKNYKGKVTFAISNEEEFENELVQLNLDDSGEDVNVGYFESRNVRYRMDPVEDFSSDDLEQFVKGVQAGKIPRHIKSQPVPKDNTGPVISVVGTTFEDVVSRSEKDILLEFYAPWCGHCKQLEPIYKKLGKAFFNNGNILIAKIDATTNDYPSQFEVNGFPTIYYIPASDKSNILTYDGERNLKELTKFINQQISKLSEKDEL